MSEVDESLHGVTELRIHGVSGTPPQDMLQFPTVHQVAGDRKSGFYRRWAPAGASPDLPDPAGARRNGARNGSRDGGPGRHRLEAYSWGGLTSGGASRALWLLLLPFALVNLASWTEPGDPSQAPRRRRVLEALLRLFALSLTGSLVVAACSISMDLLAWQCAEPGSRCAEQHIVAALLALLPSAGAQLAVAALVPAALVGLLWYLGNATWRRYEAEHLPQQGAAPGTGAERAVPLADPAFWEGQVPVRRLRALHVTSAAAGIGVFLAQPARSAGSAPVRLAAGVTLTLLLLLILLCVAAVLVPRIADRRAAGTHPDVLAVFGRRLPAPSDLAPAWTWLPWIGFALAGLAAVEVTLAGDDVVPEGLFDAAPFAAGLDPGVPNLPLVNSALYLGLGLQFLLLAAMTVLNRTLPRDPDPVVPLAVRGHALPLMVATGWLLGGALSAGGTLRAAQWLGDPVADPEDYALAWEQMQVVEGAPVADQLLALQAPQPLYVPALYYWVSLVAALTALALVLVLLPALGVRLNRLARRRTARFGREPGTARDRAIARIEDLARLTDEAPGYLAVLVLFCCLCGVAVVAGLAVPEDVLPPEVGARVVPWLTELGAWFVGLVALGLVSLGAAAYRTPHLRRTVGILWDVASFWPRAVHPLAPPCYSERVLPELVNRARALTGRPGDALLFSGHSQGSVIALAAVLQLGEPAAGRSCLLTYGSPLTRLYAAFFPGYVNRHAYRAAAWRMGCRGEHDAWPWLNLYRLSDPIGGWVLTGADGDPATAGVLDRRLVDPSRDPRDGDLAWPMALGHSGYWLDPAFSAATLEVLGRRTAGSYAGHGPGPGARSG